MTDIKTAMISGVLAAFAATAAQATTINPADYDSIFTEGKRTETVGLLPADRADISGNSALATNGDIGAFDFGSFNQGDTVLVAGRISNTGADMFLANNVTGSVTVSILNYAESTRASVLTGFGSFRGLFEVMVDDVVVQFADFIGTTGDLFSRSFNVETLVGQSIGIRVTSAFGASDYDVSFSSADAPSAVPLPAAGLLLVGGLGGLAAMRRRKKS